MADLFQLFRHNPPPSIQYSHHQQSQPVRTYQPQNVYSTPTQQVATGSKVVMAHGNQRAGHVANKTNQSSQDIWVSQPDKVSEGSRFHQSPARTPSSNRATPHYIQAGSVQSNYQSRFTTAPAQQHPYNNMQTGVGIEFESGRLVVAALVPGCSAARSGEVEAGDEMVAVEGYEDIDLSRARSLILGRQGTNVTLTFRRRQQRYKVKLMRGTHDYLETKDQCQAAETRVRELEDQVSKLVAENDKLEGALHTTGPISGQNSQQHEYVTGLQTRVKELEGEVQNMKKERQEAHDVLLNQKNEEIRSKTTENDLLRMQVTSLQKLIGEKDGQVTQTKAKAREQQTAMVIRLRDAEDGLKEEVLKTASKDETISALNKRLAEANAEMEELRVENKKLREKRLADVDSITMKQFADPGVAGSPEKPFLSEAAPRSSPLPVSLKASIVPKLPLGTMNQSGSVQTFQHVQQQVQFQEPPSSARRESESPASTSVLDLQISSPTPKPSVTSPPQRQLLNDSPAPYPLRDGPAPPQPWGVMPASRPQQLSSYSPPPVAASARSGYPTPAPAPSPTTPKDRRQTLPNPRDGLTPPGTGSALSAYGGSSPPGSPGDVHLSQRPGAVTAGARIIGGSFTGSGSGAASSNYHAPQAARAAASRDVSFRTRAPHSASPYSMPSYSSPAPQSAGHLGSYNFGHSINSYPGMHAPPMFSPPPPVQFGAPQWGRQW